MSGEVTYGVSGPLGAVESLRRLGLEARNRRMANIISPCDIGQDLSRLSPSQSLPPLMG